MPNWRLPPLPETHADEVCKSQACKKQINSSREVKIASKIGQRAQRQCTGYYCGYSFKPQPIGSKFLRLAADSMNYLTTGMEDKAVGKQWHRITHRVLQDLQHRCMRRTAPEEFNLASNYHPHDIRAAEFIRTYRSVDFPGGALIRRFELEHSKADATQTKKVLPARHAPVDSQELWLKQFDELYGYRGNNGEVYLLSPWEFVMLWECVQLPKPCRREDAGGSGSKKKKDSEEDETDSEAKAVSKRTPLTIPKKDGKDGDDYDVNPAAESRDVVFFPEVNGDTFLRKTWYMRRLRRPMVPAPSRSPMPDKQPDADGKAKVFSVYLRPWVLDRRMASKEVPHIADLDVVPTKDSDVVRTSRRRITGKRAISPETRRSFAASWTWYVRGNVVSRHARKLIIQFMAACCGRSKGRDGDEASGDEQEKKSHVVPDNHLPLERIHAILDSMSAATPETPSKSKRKKPEQKDERKEEIDDDEVDLVFFICTLFLLVATSPVLGAVRSSMRRRRQ